MLKGVGSFLGFQILPNTISAEKEVLSIFLLVGRAG